MPPGIHSFFHSIPARIFRAFPLSLRKTAGRRSALMPADSQGVTWMVHPPLSIHSRALW